MTPHFLVVASAALAGGLLFGTGYFWAISVTTDALARGANAYLTLAAGLRFLAALAAFSLLAHMGTLPLAAGLVGFEIARALVLVRLRRER